jgi:hypothetical protein
MKRLLEWARIKGDNPGQPRGGRRGRMYVIGGRPDVCKWRSGRTRRGRGLVVGAGWGTSRRAVPAAGNADAQRRRSRRPRELGRQRSRRADAQAFQPLLPALPLSSSSRKSGSRSSIAGVVCRTGEKCVPRRGALAGLNLACSPCPRDIMNGLLTRRGVRRQIEQIPQALPGLRRRRAICVAVFRTENRPGASPPRP